MSIRWDDRLLGSSVDAGVPGMMRAVRTTIIKQSTLGKQPWEMLSTAILDDGVPQPGEPHPMDPRCLLSRVRAEPIDDVSTRLSLIYERVPAVTYVEDCATVPIKTQCMPGTRRQIQMTYSGTGWPGTLTRTGAIIYRCPMRKLVLGKALFGFPLNQLVPNEVKNSIGAVNDRPWMGMRRGYWLCDGLGVQAVEPDDNFETALCFYVVAKFYSQVVHDWSFWQFLQLPNGQYVKVTDADIDAAIAKGYNGQVYHPYPVLWPNQTAVQYNAHPDFYAPAGKGFVVTYPYPALDFYSVFGVQ